ncbi:penicillin-binding transpeptidase domain-containing protein [Microbacterium sp. NPDC055683]
MPISSTRLAAVALLPLLLPLAACADTRGDAARAAADELVAALQDRSLEGVADAAAAEAFAAQAEPLAAYDVSVAAGEVEREEAAATVPLSWSWDVEGHTWEYETVATLVEEDGAWTADWSSETFVPGLAADEQLSVTRSFGPRADIVDASGDPIVTERAVGRYGLDKANVDPAAVGESAERIAAAVGIDAAAYRATAEGAGPQAFVEAIVVREGEEDRYVSADFASIPGALVVADEIPLAPTRTFARELLGIVGQATAEAVEASDGAVRAGDEVGLSGLQQTYDAALRGTPDVVVEAVAGEDRRELAAWEGEDGTPLVLTLDQDMQIGAEEILAGLGDDAPASAMVAIRPSTGEVLAAANGLGAEGMNIATTGAYAPGSTFKLVTSLALLRAGVGLDDVLSCPESLTVDGYTFSNYDDYPASALGEVAFRTAIAHSCNTALIGARDRIDEGALESAAAALGLGGEIDLGYPASLGQVPAPEGETEKAADLIGQGRVLATPLAMATVAASVQAGETVVPHLLVEETGTADADVPLTPDEASSLQELMRAVVTDGSATFLAGVPGEPVGAKTGTAEYGEPDADGAYATHSWMVGTHGDLAVAVFVEDGVSGAETAGPLLQAFFERW